MRDGADQLRPEGLHQNAAPRKFRDQGGRRAQAWRHVKRDEIRVDFRRTELKAFAGTGGLAGPRICLVFG